jgi:hypothetical protein
MLAAQPQHACMQAHPQTTTDLYLHACRYERKLMRYLEDLIREMDRKIAKARERAEKESAPKPIKPDDQMRLDELQMRAKGG